MAGQQAVVVGLAARGIHRPLDEHRPLVTDPVTSAIAEGDDAVGVLFSLEALRSVGREAFERSDFRRGVCKYRQEFAGGQPLRKRARLAILHHGRMRRLAESVHGGDIVVVQRERGFDSRIPALSTLRRAGAC
jgi:hypothetical protein